MDRAGHGADNRLARGGLLGLDDIFQRLKDAYALRQVLLEAGNRARFWGPLPSLPPLSG